MAKGLRIGPFTAEQIIVATGGEVPRLSETGSNERELGVGMAGAVGMLIPGPAGKERAAANLASHSKEFSGALSKAVGWLESRGFKAEQETIGKFGSNVGKPIGMQTLDGKVGFRVEYDARNGAHINVWAGKEKGPHFTFQGTQEMVDRIVKQFR